jgi:hypothetical protein
LRNTALLVVTEFAPITNPVTVRLFIVTINAQMTIPVTIQILIVTIFDTEIARCIVGLRTNYIWDYAHGRDHQGASGMPCDRDSGRMGIIRSGRTGLETLNNAQPLGKF